MTKRAKLLVIGITMAVIMAISIGTVAYAAGPVNSSNCGLQAGVCNDVVTKLLGMTTAEIQALRQNGKTLVQIAATKGITEVKLVEAIMAEKKVQVQARVTAGTLTKEQANLMLQNMEQNTIRAVNRTTTGPNGNGACLMAGNSQQNAVRGGCGCSGLGTGAGIMRGFGRNR